ncbi:hypothetical protein MTO96_027462 [Rhipicephalus appendiculatus]
MLLLARDHECSCSSFSSSAVELFFPGGYSVRIRDSNTPGRKVGLWGCDFCAFTHANVSKVQAHVQEQHLVALRRNWETTATLWQAGESRGDALCSDESGSARWCR